MTLYSKELELFESFCQNEFQALFSSTDDSVTSILATIDAIQGQILNPDKVVASMPIENLQFESIKYSFNSGGKRFRPLLSFAAAKYLDVPVTSVFPWAMAIEMIHTYSLIHDDLPSMDNDDYRRGKPTNHKIFGEAVALLSGDGLLTEAFALLAKHYSNTEVDVNSLIIHLAKASGLSGMILGQYFDISVQESSPSISDLNRIHLLKTGALISGAFTGPALIRNISGVERHFLQEIGFLLGYAFQVKDDLLDSPQDKDSKKNLNYYFQGRAKLTLFLERIHQEIEIKIKMVDSIRSHGGDRSACLTEFLAWNASREK